MDSPWHITVEVPDKEWGTVEGLKTLCAGESKKIIRFQFFDIFSKTNVNESEVCKECLGIMRGASAIECC